MICVTINYTWELASRSFQKYSVTTNFLPHTVKSKSLYNHTITRYHLVNARYYTYNIICTHRSDIHVKCIENSCNYKYGTLLLYSWKSSQIKFSFISSLSLAKSLFAILSLCWWLHRRYGNLDSTNENLFHRTFWSCVGLAKSKVFGYYSTYALLVDQEPTIYHGRYYDTFWSPPLLSSKEWCNALRISEACQEYWHLISFDRQHWFTQTLKPQITPPLPPSTNEHWPLT